MKRLTTTASLVLLFSASFFFLALEAANAGETAKNKYGPYRSPVVGNQTPAPSIPTSFSRGTALERPTAEYRKGRILIKIKQVVQQGRTPMSLIPEVDNVLQGLGVSRLRRLFPKASSPQSGETIRSPLGITIPKPDLSQWYIADVPDENADLHELSKNLKTHSDIEHAEPDFTMKLSELPGNTSDQLYASQWHLAAARIPEAWAYLENQGLPPGGSRNVIVSVIDTGVDYNHPDLAVNIWTNSREVIGNGVDEDGNGYVDDVHGVDVIVGSGNPMDDHGHGTHVAGIIAAQALNGIGGVGVAYNVQIMPIKAAQYSGVLTASDVAKAIQYSVENGADVINMSFGGYGKSQIIEDALAIAFGQAVLVAAAGNDALPNEGILFSDRCKLEKARPMYPASYNWVLGVMATKPDGEIAEFSNFDCIPRDTIEYELMAPGVDIWSTLPNGQYAAWDGTSMAAPIVSGIAALVRTKFPDKDSYSSRFIMGQIAANSKPTADASAALTVLPKPELKYIEHWLFDNKTINAANDDDGRTDSGETIDLAVVIRNHWGKADNVQVTLRAWNGVAETDDPYVTILTPTVEYGAVGSFNNDDNGLLYNEQGEITGVQNPFRFTVHPDCPNNHMISFQVTMTARNGMDPVDSNVYTTSSSFSVLVQRGRELPNIISQDMALTKDNLWIVVGPTLVESGVTVTVSPGTKIQFGAPQPSNPNPPVSLPYIQVEGNLHVFGTYDEPVEMFGAEILGSPAVAILNFNGDVKIYYARVINPRLGWTYGYIYPGSGQPLTLIDHLYAEGEGGQWQISSRALRNSVLRGLGPTDVPLGISSSLDIDTVLFERSSQTTHYGVYFNGSIANSVIRSGDLKFVTVFSNTPSNGPFINNAFLNTFTPNTGFTAYSGDARSAIFPLIDNFWGTSSESVIRNMIYDIDDDFNIGRIEYRPFLTIPATTTYPFVVDVRISDINSQEAHIVGAGEVIFTVTFNRDMDQAIQPQVSFGPDIPMTDYSIHPINGGWSDSRTWMGTFNVTPLTGDGYQLIHVAGARAADDPWLVTGADAGRFRFEIITSGTEAMNLQATGGEGYVDLAWTQNDFPLLAGYNLYRSDTSVGVYTRFNPTIIPSNQKSFRDASVEPGKIYYYKFSVVKTDMTESRFSNIATATAIDTVNPIIVHTPITQAAPGMSLTFYADVTDNILVTSATLHFKNIGTQTYITRNMVKTTGNRYSATIESTYLTSPGIEYYIAASDGLNTVNFGRPEYPYQVSVIDKPVVTVVSPNKGPSPGGTTVTIAGSNFKTGATVTFGGAVAEALNVVNSSRIDCTTPPHFPIMVDVSVSNPDGQSGLLLRGYTYESDTVSVSLPNVSGGQYAIIQVPVNVANLNGLAAADITVTFDDSILRATGARTGNIAPGWSMATNIGTPGQIRISMASSGGTVGGTGVLAYLEFEVIGLPGSNGSLQLSSVSLNDGAMPVNTANGNVSVNLVYDLAGTVAYWSNGEGVPGATLTLSGDRIYTGVSGENGSYTVSGVPTDSYSLAPVKSNDVREISAYDASLVLQKAAGLITLTGNAFIAGDVDKSGTITSMDAFHILQKAVDLISLPFPGAGVVWNFNPANRNYENLTSTQTGQDFTAILLGDVSGNWSSGAGIQGMMQPESISRVPLDKSIVSIRLNDTKMNDDGTLRMSVWIYPGSVKIYSLDLILDYNAEKANIVSANIGSSLRDWMISTNVKKPGEIKISIAGAFPISGPGIILNLDFQLTPPANNISAVPRRILINEGQVTHYLLTESPTTGDINKDYKIDLADAILVMQVLAGMDPVDFRAIYTESGDDTDNNNKINLAEAIYVLQKTAGMDE